MVRFWDSRLTVAMGGRGCSGFTRVAQIWCPVIFMLLSARHSISASSARAMDLGAVGEANWVAAWERRDRVSASWGSSLDLGAVAQPTTNNKGNVIMNRECAKKDEKNNFLVWR